MYGLINHLPSLFPRLGCGAIGGISLHGNPVSRELETKLNEDIKRRKEVRCYSIPVVSLCVILLCISVVVCFCVCDCVYILSTNLAHMLTALFHNRLSLFHPLWLILKNQHCPSLRKRTQSHTHLLYRHLFIYLWTTKMVCNSYVS